MFYSYFIVYIAKNRTNFYLVPGQTGSVSPVTEQVVSGNFSPKNKKIEYLVYDPKCLSTWYK